MPRKTRRSRPRPVLLLVTLLLVAGALVLWTRSGDTAPAAAGTAPAPPTASAPVSEHAPSEPAASESASSVDADEPVAEESDAEELDNAPEETSEPASPATPEVREADGPAPVAVSLTYTSYDSSTSAVVAGGYAADVVEVDATCTLVLRRDGVELRGEALGTPSAATTDCGEVRVGGDALTSGTWEAVLTYTSETSVGESDPVEVEVP